MNENTLIYSMGNDDRFDKEKRYWLEKFSGEFIKSYFPYDDLKTGLKPEPATVEIPVAADLAARLIKLGNDSDIKLHMILVAGLMALQHKYMGNHDITVGIPIYKQEVEGDFINTVLGIRYHFTPEVSFKELLLGVRENIVAAVEHQNYPMDYLIQQLGIPYTVNDAFPLFDSIIMLESIHQYSYVKDIRVGTVFDFKRSGSKLSAVIHYDSHLYKAATLERLMAHFQNLFRKLLDDVNLPIREAEMIGLDDKERILDQFNNTVADYSQDKTIPELFEDRVQKTPDKIAVSFTFDAAETFRELEQNELTPSLLTKTGNLCFTRNLYIRICQPVGPYALALERLIPDAAERSGKVLVETHRSNLAVLNQDLLELLPCFNGENNLQSIFAAVAIRKPKLSVWPVAFHVTGDPEVIRHDVVPGELSEFVKLVKILMENNLVALSGYDSTIKNVEIPGSEVFKTQNANSKVDTGSSHPADQDIPLDETAYPRQPVLLLGDTTGAATTGLLYLASYLRRHGVKAYCHWTSNCREYASFKNELIRLLADLKPRIVGVSMKWFSHIARSLEICKIVKEYDPAIKVVVGGNTATDYNREVIQYEWIDYIVLGDGEVPLLEICRNAPTIPNCIIKQNGAAVETAISYIQNEQNTGDIYLSHLDEIFTTPDNPLRAPEFFIYTGKGCSANCIYCAGCAVQQKKTFGRGKPFMRGVEEVRRDLMEAKAYTGRFMFDFDLPNYDSLDYYQKIWEGIDLAEHFCLFYFWKLPSPEFLTLVSRTFKHATLSIDLCSLSERHRLQLASLKLVKPQPTNAEILALLDECGKYPNVEVRVSTIGGLPYSAPEDVAIINGLIKQIMDKYPFVVRIDWERLHAQPGAPLVTEGEKYGMYSEAVDFQDFLHFSELSLKEEYYPELENLYYPAIFFKDARLNSLTTNHYLEISKIIRQFELKRQMRMATQSMTYTELNRRANQLARVLTGKGVKPGSIVGIMTERSQEMAVGIMAVLKAGGAYLPIDPDYPLSRIEYMLEDSQTGIVLTQMHLLKQVAFGGEWIAIDELETSAGDTADLGPVNISGDPAYLIYTSGSTGKPKGVLVEHRGVSNLKSFFDQCLGIRDTDRVVQFASFSFDASVWEMAMSLLVGGTLCLVHKDIINDTGKFETFMNTRQITVATLPPPYLANLDPERITTLKKLVAAGSASNWDLVQKWSPIVEYVNAYGPTETTVCASFWKAEPGKNPGGNVPIGRPVSNTHIYIVDRYHKLQPIGLPGEICIAGTGLARGYHRRPELTAEQFVPNPFAGDEFSRTNAQLSSVHFQQMYKTGDLGRWLPDGNIEFLGRMDHQVKIRGFRIELGEIEGSLLNHSHIREVAVTVETDETGNGSLCAYYVSDAVLAGMELREYLAGQLPDYMVPSYFIPMEKFPLTPSGKIDLRSLPKPQDVLGKNQNYVPAETENEARLVKIWQEVLGVEQVGTRNNFFELGGDSLKATILVGNIQKEFDMEISLREVFKAPTIQELSEFIDKGRTKLEDLQKLERILGEIENAPVE